jgi:murein DD-endopeptidase MepM/ murein hydrolase activator NlpD
VAPAQVSERTVDAVVPPKALSGRLTVRDRWGNQATTTGRIRVTDAPASQPIDITPTSSRFFFDSRRKPTYAFEVPEPLEVDVQLVRAETSDVVRTWSVDAQPGATSEVKWNGLDTGGDVARGNFRFRLTGEAASAGTRTAESQDTFGYADHLFPIRGRHNLGYTETNNFGGGRGHQGQDMFARCGTRLAAARGGRVEYAGWHSAAGNYVVIDGAETGVDYVYMHLLEVPLVKTGQRVFTGQKIGEVGETGRATGCHLHFEMWSAPGWYKGGQPFDPLPALRLWDGYS